MVKDVRRLVHVNMVLYALQSMVLVFVLLGIEEIVASCLARRGSTELIALKTVNVKIMPGALRKRASAIVLMDGKVANVKDHVMVNFTDTTVTRNANARIMQLAIRKMERAFAHQDFTALFVN